MSYHDAPEGAEAIDWAQDSYNKLKEIRRLRRALRRIAYDDEGEEPDLPACMIIATDALNQKDKP